ncbi:hypothetical protein BT96DRAFT_868392 [Gymnopus androsaceus JB14]|uniref:Uncharacterized protein n=1 Tax=Gymnopus androsaceus JB14 TaxID=1447944 RepID=A0A6A4GJI3_9AGAR|nr:hypothetical protein BT96DRAFT_868392 [Gymnopus androsaceus JB14]
MFNQPYLSISIGLLCILTIINVVEFVGDISNTRSAVHDVPQNTKQIWKVEGLRQAAITPEESVHFKLDTLPGSEEWASVLPMGDGVVVLNESLVFRVAIFHQLECLNVIRMEMLRRRDNSYTPASKPAQFCLDYLRQSILCHGDHHLEMVRSEYGGRAVLPYTTRTDCLDWEAVWRAAEANFEETKVLAGGSTAVHLNES